MTNGFDNIRELNAAELDEVAGGIKIKIGNSEIDVLEDDLVKLPPISVPSLPGL